MNSKKLLVGAVASIVIASSSVYSYAESIKTAGPQGNGTGVTTHGWMLTPAGKQITLGDFPMGGAISPNGKYLVVSNDGQGTQSLQVIDIAQQKVVQTIPCTSPQALYLGVAFSPDGKTLYASAGGNNKIRVFQFDNGKLKEQAPIKMKDNKGTDFYPAGLSVSPDGKYLYVADNIDGSVSKISLADQTIKATTSVGKNPYTTLVSQDGKSIYVSNWGENTVTVLNAADMSVRKIITVGLHPNALAKNPVNGLIYVSNSDSDTISIINPAKQKVIDTVSLSPYKKAKTGSQPDSLTVSPDGQTLYAANSGNNDIAVINLGKPKQQGNNHPSPKVKGWIPTAWYPTGVYLNKEANQLMVLNAKGLGAGPNTDGQYVGNMIKGTLSFVNVPAEGQLRKYTQQVKKNNQAYRPGSDDHKGEHAPIPRTENQKSPIKHVIYVIKENRTYDQVFGDVKRGNGDPNYTMFGNKVTPNLHKLAKQFVTLDNFYADAEISAQGHNWATAAKANDYVEKNWMANYSGRNRGYDFEGSNSATYPKAGFIWDDAARSGVSFRDYGEFTSYDNTKGSWVPNDPSIGNRFDPQYPGWNLNISDLTRFKEWNKEFQQYVKNGNLPQLEIVRLPNDHTYGTTPGKLSPQSMVAQNDYAVGKLVDAVSHSKYWKNTAIFITEDDAQNGVDHVDAHRTESLVVSPYTQIGKVDSTFYDTTSMIRTMELILGMKPMTQYDASAVPMLNSFTSHPNFNPYNAVSPTYPLDQRNGTNTPGAQASAKLNFSRADLANEKTLNHILWKDIKGNKLYPHSKYNPHKNKNPHQKNHSHQK